MTQVLPQSLKSYLWLLTPFLPHTWNNYRFLHLFLQNTFRIRPSLTTSTGHHLPGPGPITAHRWFTLCLPHWSSGSCTSGQQPIFLQHLEPGHVPAQNPAEGALLRDLSPRPSASSLISWSAIFCTLGSKLTDLPAVPQTCQACSCLCAGSFLHLECSLLRQPCG